MYKLKYIGNNQTELTNFSDAIEVPVLPPVQLSLDAPSNGQVISSTVSSIRFKWSVTYPTAMVSGLTSAKVLRKDFLYITEVSTTNTIYASSSPVYDVNGASTGQMQADYLLSFGALPVRGKRYSWTITSSLEYEDEKLDASGNGRINVNTVSYPTVVVYGYKGASQDGVLYFIIE